MTTATKVKVYKKIKNSYEIDGIFEYGRGNFVHPTT